jgi:hypothetical protein
MNIRPEIQTLIARGNVTSAELAELRCNSWEWEALVPAMDDEAFVGNLVHTLGNCSRASGRPFASYDEAIINLHTPELVRRFKLARAASADLVVTEVALDEAGEQRAAAVKAVQEREKTIYELNCRVRELKQEIARAPHVVSNRPSWVEFYDKWMAENRDAYAGKSVALKGSEVVDSDESRSALQGRLKSRPDIREIVVVQIERDGEAPMNDNSLNGTQLERANAIIARLKVMLPELSRLSRDLAQVVGDAQNGPPDGGADGTISDVRWTQLKNAERALSKLVCSLDMDGC